MAIANVCIELADMRCPHYTGPLVGQLVVVGSGNSKLKGSSINVLTKFSITGLSVIGCPYNPGSPSPCAAIFSIASESAKLKIDSSGVILDSTIILVVNPTLGNLPITINSAGQTKLTEGSA